MCASPTFNLSNRAHKPQQDTLTTFKPQKLFTSQTLIQLTLHYSNQFITLLLMALNFTMIGENGDTDFDSKPTKTPDGVHRSETWLKNSAQKFYLHGRQFLGLDGI